MSPVSTCINSYLKFLITVFPMNISLKKFVQQAIKIDLTIKSKLF